MEVTVANIRETFEQLTWIENAVKEYFGRIIEDSIENNKLQPFVDIPLPADNLLTYLNAKITDADDIDADDVGEFKLADCVIYTKAYFDTLTESGFKVDYTWTEDLTDITTLRFSFGNVFTFSGGITYQ